MTCKVVTECKSCLVIVFFNLMGCHFFSVFSNGSGLQKAEIDLEALPTVACREYRASYLSFGLCAVCTQHANHHLPSFLMFQRGFGTYWSTCEMSIGKKRPRFFKSSTTTVPLELCYQKHLLTRNWSRSRVKMGLSCLWWCSTFPFFFFPLLLPLFLF